ncbi:MAG TPA: MFS transporter [Gemmataceae bacterium]|jgi:MFS family permease|nr:MFS transporter [Gemmataceae bacterium]
MGPPPDPAPVRTGWGSLLALTKYQWFVFIVACLAWDLDCMDQQLFNVARRPAMKTLVPAVSADDDRLPALREKLTAQRAKNDKPPPTDQEVIAAQTDADVAHGAAQATSIFLIGWAIGGIGFGIMGDRLGRVRTLMLTILLYSVFTGLSAFSTSVIDFGIYRFLTGLGVGAVFAVSVALVAETVPQAARPYALGLLQMSSAFGNMIAATVSIVLGYMKIDGQLGDIKPWKVMFLIGVIPAFLIVLIQSRLKEPEAWTKARAEQKAGTGKPLGSFKELFGDPRLRSRAIFGVLLAFAGVVGLWGIAFFAPDLQSYVFRPVFQDEATSRALSGDAAKDYVDGRMAIWGGWTSMLLNAGAALGIFAYSWLTPHLGRKLTFALAFIAAALSTAFVFWKLSVFNDIFWMMPIMGFCQLAVFGGYAIYFPELFPTRLRSTGTSFCYNVGRLVAALGPAALGLLTSQVYAGYDAPGPLRYAGMTMCSVFLIGLAVLPFLPETKDKPLPE